MHVYWESTLENGWSAFMSKIKIKMLAHESVLLISGTHLTHSMTNPIKILSAIFLGKEVLELTVNTLPCSLIMVIAPPLRGAGTDFLQVPADKKP